MHLVEEFENKKIRVAVSNLVTSDDSWEMRVKGKPDLNKLRLSRILGLVKRFLIDHKENSWSDKPLYFCFPELSIPREWLAVISSYFEKARVSLIVGGEYEKSVNEDELVNPAYLFLRNKNLGYPSLYVFRQLKTEPAPGEAIELKKLKKKMVGPADQMPPVYRHGDFYFGLMICSELTDVKFHEHFRGNVDVFFCLEWNKDINTFSSIVESTAQTIHAYAVQVNNRQYGDSRIRGPYKLDYQRDVVRIRGGNHDYFAAGDIKVKELRDFQKKSNFTDDEKDKFKPTPSGFRANRYMRLILSM